MVNRILVYLHKLSSDIGKQFCIMVHTYMGINMGVRGSPKVVLGEKKVG